MLMCRFNILMFASFVLAGCAPDDSMFSYRSGSAPVEGCEIAASSSQSAGWSLVDDQWIDVTGDGAMLEGSLIFDAEASVATAWVDVAPASGHAALPGKLPWLKVRAVGGPGDVDIQTMTFDGGWSRPATYEQPHRVEVEFIPPLAADSGALVGFELTSESGDAAMPGMKVTAWGCSEGQ